MCLLYFNKFRSITFNELIFYSNYFARDSILKKDPRLELFNEYELSIALVFFKKNHHAKLQTFWLFNLHLQGHRHCFYLLVVIITLSDIF